MAFKITRKELIERPASDSLIAAPSKFLRAQSTTLGPLPADQHVVLIAVGVDQKLSGAQLDQLEVAIKAITIVQAAKVAITGKTPPAGRVPATHEIHLRIDGQVIVELKPVEE